MYEKPSNIARDRGRSVVIEVVTVPIFSSFAVQIVVFILS